MNDLSNIELNGIIECLIESKGSDEDTRLQLASFARSMKPASSMSMKLTRRDRGSKMRGLTPYRGNIDISTDGEMRKEWTVADRKERIGLYKIGRWPQSRFYGAVYAERFIIEHFWKSGFGHGICDRGTESLVPLLRP